MNGLARIALALAVAALGACATSSAEQSRRAGSESEDADLTYDLDSEGSVEATPSRRGDEGSAPGQPLRYRHSDGVVSGAGVDAPDGDMPPGDTPALASDPHHKRAGTDELPRHAAARAAYFVPSAAEPRPVPRLRQPTLVSAARLAVACVRGGQIVGDPDALLALEGLLSKERGISAVLALPPPNEAAIGLKGLAAQAKRLGRQLLLVDVISPDQGRVGYLVHTESGKLIARYEPKSGSPVSGSGSGLLSRLGECYGRLASK